MKTASVYDNRSTSRSTNAVFLYCQVSLSRGAALKSKRLRLLSKKNKYKIKLDIFVRNQKCIVQLNFVQELGRVYISDYYYHCYISIIYRYKGALVNFDRIRAFIAAVLMNSLRADWLLFHIR